LEAPAIAVRDSHQAEKPIGEGERFELCVKKWNAGDHANSVREKTPLTPGAPLVSAGF